MNKQQLFVLWVTIGFVVVLSSFPMQTTDGNVSKIRNHKDRGRVYFLSNKLRIFKDGHEVTSYRCSIDVGALISQTIIFVAIGTGLIITLKDKKS